MKQITILEAKQRLLAACPGLYANLTIDLREEPNSRAYEYHGAVILKTMIHYSSSEIKPIWYICDAGSSNLAAAQDALRRKKRKATYYISPRAGENCLVFSRLGEAYDDPAIRPLTPEDEATICSILHVAEDDSEEARIIAGIIRSELATYIVDPTRHFLGLFEETALRGVLVYNNRGNGEVTVINDVFVPREQRGRGFAVRLVRAATAVHPGARYVYSCGSQNFASIATAKKAGYMLAGTVDFS